MFPQKNPLKSSNILKYLEKNLICWTSRNEKIDNFIQEIQLKFNSENDVIFEWIPYNQFNEIKEIDKNGLRTVYSAIWKDGPIFYNDQYNKYTRDSNKKVSLKCLHNSQDSIDFLINEAKMYSTKYNAFLALYGISQNPDTNDYILLVQYNSINIAKWFSGNEKIDDFIQEMQLKMRDHYDNVFEWIPYNHLDKIKETGKHDSTIVYSAIWKDGPLFYNNWYNEYTRDPNKKVALKYYFHNSQNSIDFLINKINEVKKYSTKRFNRVIWDVYGLSQNPNTNNYILVLEWASGNEKIDDFIQEMQLKRNSHNDIIFEWIPHDQLDEIEEIGKSPITVHSAIWNNGPLFYSNLDKRYMRESNTNVALKHLHSSQNSIEILISELKKHLTSIFGRKVAKIYGISQNPDTSDYILVQKNLILMSGIKKLDDFIQEMQLKINHYDDAVFEWIPYNQFNEIEEIGKNTNSITMYSAVWKDGQLLYNYQYKHYTRDSSIEVALRCLHNSEDSIDSLINEAKKYLPKKVAFAILYGISQNPDTNDYILVQNNFINLANWISGNEKIDDFIQEKLLKRNNHKDIVFEWIPYDQLDEIEEIDNNDSTVYHTMLKDGPLYYDDWDLRYTRKSRKVVLKYLYNSLNSVDSLINEV
ncbi:hypothetical protein RirG_244070 [Rhizophagus irregularis DAOM 197198w]|uniref:Protein kinase domain-containing protein n=1 Tax=Rhizophagus irregularis (strain DAOM 197198w) TaxID=1432141 RepID=A0A015IH95_RHIIW|nr:hypothetical protein RirG_244070 [Rhizophagus irregularis DAOM 197198w]